MGVFADSLFTALMSWVRALVNSIWALFTSEQTTSLEFLGKNWVTIVIVLVVSGLAVDWLIWMIRWKPYALRRRMREVHRREEEEADEARARAMFDEHEEDEEQMDDYLDGEDDLLDEDDDWLPEPPVIDESEERQAIERAQEVPDEELGVYPGMLYDGQAKRVQEEESIDGTRRYAAVHQEGPGAEEVARRRAEIDAWQQQMKDEARAERARRMEEMRLAEEKRLAEEARLAQEERLNEEARQAQEEYQRQLQEYEMKKAQYEQELAQYQRDMAAYEAAVAAQQSDTETAQEIAADMQTGRTRSRRRMTAYSDMVEGEIVEELPQGPQWPKMDRTVSEVKKTAAQKNPEKKNRLVGKMAQLIEPEHEEIAGVNALPPRVDPKAAYKPAAKPEIGRTERRK